MGDVFEIKKKVATDFIIVFEREIVFRKHFAAFGNKDRSTLLVDLQKKSTQYQNGLEKLSAERLATLSEEIMQNSLDIVEYALVNEDDKQFLADCANGLLGDEMILTELDLSKIAEHILKQIDDQLEDDTKKA